MALKRNKYIVIILILPLLLEAQFTSDTVFSGSERAEQPYSDSDQLRQNAKYLEQGLNKSDWEKLRKGIDYSEDSFRKVKKQERDSTVYRTIVNQDLGRLKYVWLILVIGILVAVLILLWPYFKSVNSKKSGSIEIEDAQADEATLRVTDFKQALDEALGKGDYRLAFRIRYLEVLQLMVLKNIIDYRNERTNMDYLRQISEKNLKHLFRQVTLYFEEVWYGEMAADQSSFERMSEVVTQIKTVVSKR